MTLSGTNISMTRGDTESLTVRCTPPFAEGDAVTMTVREDAQSAVRFRKTVTEFGAEGEAIIAIDHEDTAPMDFGDYVYDIQLDRENGTVTTLVPISRFRLEEEVSYE